MRLDALRNDSDFACLLLHDPNDLLPRLRVELIALGAAGQGLGLASGTIVIRLLISTNAKQW
jgi:hypothetical protein